MIGYTLQKKQNVMYACNQEINYMIKYNENEDENE